MLMKRLSLNPSISRVIADIILDNVRTVDQSEPLSIVEVAVHLSQTLHSMSQANELECEPPEIDELNYVVLHNMFGTIGSCSYIGPNSDEEDEPEEDDDSLSDDRDGLVEQ